MGYVSENPWLVLGITADPASIDTYGTSAIRTNLTYNKTKTAGSQPVGDTSGMGHVPDRILNTFSLDPDSGSVLPPTDWTVNGVAQTTFIPESSGPAVIKATVDDQDVFLTIPVAQAPPVAGFFGTPASGPASLMVQFNDTSRYSPLMWNWSFGDGTWTNTTDLTKRNVSHRYSSIGTHTVSLTVSNAGGTDTHSETNYITVTDPVSPTTFSGTPRPVQPRSRSRSPGPHPAYRPSGTGPLVTAHGSTQRYRGTTPAIPTQLPGHTRSGLS
jgi:PKD repeat protein